MIELQNIKFTQKFNKEDLHKICSNSGIYRLYNSNKELMYIGKTKNLKSRLGTYFNKTDKNTIDVSRNFTYCDFSILDDPVDRDIYETYFINKLKPPLNVDKVFTYNTKRYDPKYNTYEQIRRDRFDKRMDAAMKDFVL